MLKQAFALESFSSLQRAWRSKLDGLLWSLQLQGLPCLWYPVENSAIWMSRILCVISPTYADPSIQAEGLYSEAGQEAYQKEEDPVWTLLCRCSPKECGQARPPGCEPWI